VRELKGLAEARGFSEYFTREALVNRPARKLFEAWLRKDRTLWPRLFKIIHREIDIKDVAAAEEALEKNLAARSGEKPVKDSTADVPAPKVKAPAKAALAETVVSAPKKAIVSTPAAESKAKKPAVAAKTTKVAEEVKETPVKAKKATVTKKAPATKAAATEPAKKAVKKVVAKKAATTTKAKKSTKGT
jgi:hypothetical protein